MTNNQVLPKYFCVRMYMYVNCNINPNFLSIVTEQSKSFKIQQLPLLSSVFKIS